MKTNKLLNLSLIFLLGFIFMTACSPSTTFVEDTGFTIGISQTTDHPALDNARIGFEDGLKELGLNAKIIYQNAQGEVPDTFMIAEKFVRDDVDLIYAIGTPAAQSAKQATPDIPVIFSAVTDPVIAELIDTMESPGANITGTSDESPMNKQLQLFKKLDPTIERVGIVFNTGENNSQVQVNLAKEISQDFGLEIVDVGVSAINDIPQAVDSIIKKVDAIYTITDNMVASAINIVAKKARENNLITVGAEDSHVAGGILITDGISYYELGKQSADMAKEILIDKKLPKDIPSAKQKNTRKTFNQDTLKSLNLDINNKVFKDAVKFEE